MFFLTDSRSIPSSSVLWRDTEEEMKLPSSEAAEKANVPAELGYRKHVPGPGRLPPDLHIQELLSSFYCILYKYQQPIKAPNIAKGP